MMWRVRLYCDACRSSFQTLVPGRLCREGSRHAHFPVEGVLQQWGEAHHQPGLQVLGPGVR